MDLVQTRTSPLALAGIPIEADLSQYSFEPRFLAEVVPKFVHEQILH